MKERNVLGMREFYISKDGNTTTAVFVATENKALSKAVKRLDLRDFVGLGYFYEDTEYNEASEVYHAFELDKLKMAKAYRGTVKLDERDEPDVEVGKEAANSKALGNYYKGMRNAFVRWQVAMLRKIMRVSPDTFDIAVEKVRKLSKTEK